MHVSPVVTYTDSVRAQERYTLTVHSISGIYAFGMLVSVLAPIIDLVDASCCSRNLQTSVSLLATCETMIGTKHKRRCGSRFSQKDSVRGRTTGGVHTQRFQHRPSMVEPPASVPCGHDSGSNARDGEAAFWFQIKWANPAHRGQLISLGWAGGGRDSPITPAYAMWILLQVEDPRGASFECVYSRENRTKDLPVGIFVGVSMSNLTGPNTPPESGSYSKTFVEIKMGPRVTNE
eukprot:3248504-Rhodomonas_salina.3